MKTSARPSQQRIGKAARDVFLPAYYRGSKGFRILLALTPAASRSDHSRLLYVLKKAIEKYKSDEVTRD
jgi:hypothetical protein